MERTPHSEKERVSDFQSKQEDYAQEWVLGRIRKPGSPVLDFSTPKTKRPSDLERLFVQLLPSPLKYLFPGSKLAELAEHEGIAPLPLQHDEILSPRRNKALRELIRRDPKLLGQKELLDQIHYLQGVVKNGTFEERQQAQDHLRSVGDALIPKARIQGKRKAWFPAKDWKANIPDPTSRHKSCRWITELDSGKR